MPDLLETGIALFNRGLWYEAHESWEDLWRDSRGQARLFYQGLIQAAVGLHHLSHGNLRGGQRVLERGLRKLGTYPPTYLGIDNRRLTEDLSSALDSRIPSTIQIRRDDP